MYPTPLLNVLREDLCTRANEFITHQRTTFGEKVHEERTLPAWSSAEVKRAQGFFAQEWSYKAQKHR